MSKNDKIYTKEQVIAMLEILAEEFYSKDESSSIACCLYHAIDFLEEK